MTEVGVEGAELHPRPLLTGKVALAVRWRSDGEPFELDLVLDETQIDLLMCAVIDAQLRAQSTARSLGLLGKGMPGADQAV